MLLTASNSLWTDLHVNGSVNFPLKSKKDLTSFFYSQHQHGVHIRKETMDWCRQMLTEDSVNVWFQIQPWAVFWLMRLRASSQSRNADGKNMDENSGLGNMKSVRCLKLRTHQEWPDNPRPQKANDIQWHQQKTACDRKWRDSDRRFSDFSGASERATMNTLECNLGNESLECP